jgi:hypothetical protein
MVVCSKACQKKEWPEHKKYCKTFSESYLGSAKKESRQKKDFQNKSGFQIYQELKANVEAMFTSDKTDPSVPKPTWEQFVVTCRKKGYDFPTPIEEEIYAEEGKYDYLKDEKLHEGLWKLYFKLSQAMLLAHVHGENKDAEIARLRVEKKAQRSAQKSFDRDGIMNTTVLLKLPKTPSDVDVSFATVTLNKTTGKRECFVLAVWKHDELKEDKIIYMKAPIHCDLKPPLNELRRALYVFMTAPTGLPADFDGGFRPRHICLSNRWGRDYFEAVAGPITQAGVLITFQSREELEKECRDAGTDIDGNDFI